MSRILNSIKDRVQPIMPNMLPGMTNDDDSDDDEYTDTERASLLTTGRRKAYRLWDGFTDFAFQGNILELAFGLILANSFTTLVTSFVSDVLLPPLSIIFPLDKNMEEKFAVLKPGPNRPEDGYTTLARAQDDGAVVMAYGAFLNKFLNFLGMGVALYGLALAYQWISKDDIIKKTMKCRYCRKRVNEKAARCINCTSWLDGREDGGVTGNRSGSGSGSAGASTAGNGMDSYGTGSAR